LSDDVLPTVIVFRNGEQIHTWVRFADQIGGVISEEAVTAWLLKEGVLTLDDEQRERLMTAHEKRIEKFKSAQLIDPELMRKLTEILK
jgi:ribosome maturation protein Sdo1